MQVSNVPYVVGTAVASGLERRTPSMPVLFTHYDVHGLDDGG